MAEGTDKGEGRQMFTRIDNSKKKLIIIPVLLTALGLLFVGTFVASGRAFAAYPTYHQSAPAKRGPFAPLDTSTSTNTRTASPTLIPTKTRTSTATSSPDKNSNSLLKQITSFGCLPRSMRDRV